MQSWQKSVIKGTVKSFLPGREVTRKVLRHFAYKTNPWNDDGLFENAIRQIEALRNAGLDVRQRRVLEIGSGWHPILPMIFLAVIPFTTVFL